MKRLTTAIRFPEPLHRKLKKAASDRGVSINFLVVRLCEEQIDHLVPAKDVKWTR